MQKFVWPKPNLTIEDGRNSNHCFIFLDFSRTFTFRWYLDRSSRIACNLFTTTLIPGTKIGRTLPFASRREPKKVGGSYDCMLTSARSGSQSGHSADPGRRWFMRLALIAMMCLQKSPIEPQRALRNKREPSESIMCIGVRFAAVEAFAELSCSGGIPWSERIP